MTVKEIFELRKQGRIEEAYDAIRPMYAAHKGKYTSLCMFWTAADIFKLRLDQSRVEEASKILEALKRVLPYIKDKDVRPENNDVPALGIDNKTRPASETAAGFITSASRRLSQAQKKQEKKQPDEDATEHNSDLIDSDNSRSKEGKREPKEETETTINSEDLSGHLALSLDEDIIRPIEGINAPQCVVLACLTAHPGYSVLQISDSTGIPAKSIERHISALIERGLIEHRGSKKTGGYYAL